jgi:uncharacterized protein YraI
VVAADQVRLRTGPATACSSVDRIPEGTGIDILSGMVVDDDGNLWTRVRRTDTGTEGWIGSTFIELLPEGTPPAVR